MKNNFFLFSILAILFLVACSTTEDTTTSLSKRTLYVSKCGNVIRVDSFVQSKNDRIFLQDQDLGITRIISENQLDSFLNLEQTPNLKYPVNPSYQQNLSMGSPNVYQQQQQDNEFQDMVTYGMIGYMVGNTFGGGGSRYNSYYDNDNDRYRGGYHYNYSGYRYGGAYPSRGNLSPYVSTPYSKTYSKPYMSATPTGSGTAYKPKVQSISSTNKSIPIKNSGSKPTPTKSTGWFNFGGGNSKPSSTSSKSTSFGKPSSGSYSKPSSTSRSTGFSRGGSFGG